mmetsp:Transcript_100825/g.325445  ORF Transcript_100825/g.325445 Transcript_100825/m.325445 type:complete len:505 (+) Transcript_100825:858-2372(+)
MIEDLRHLPHGVGRARGDGLRRPGGDGAAVLQPHTAEGLYDPAVLRVRRLSDDHRQVRELEMPRLLEVPHRPLDERLLLPLLDEQPVVDEAVEGVPHHLLLRRDALRVLHGVARHVRHRHGHPVFLVALDARGDEMHNAVQLPDQGPRVVQLLVRIVPEEVHVLKDELVGDHRIEDLVGGGLDDEGGAVHLAVHPGALRQDPAGLRLVLPPDGQLLLRLQGHRRGPGLANAFVLHVDGPGDGLQGVEVHELVLLEVHDDARDVRATGRVGPQLPDALEAVEGLLLEGLPCRDRLRRLQLDLALHLGLRDHYPEDDDLVLHDLGTEHLRELRRAAAVVVDVRARAHLQLVLVVLGLAHARGHDVAEGHLHGDLHDHACLEVCALLPLLVLDLAPEDVLQLRRALRLDARDAVLQGVLVGPGRHAVHGVVRHALAHLRRLRPRDELPLVVVELEVLRRHLPERLAVLHLALQLRLRPLRRLVCLPDLLLLCCLLLLILHLLAQRVL